MFEIFFVKKKYNTRQMVCRKNIFPINIALLRKTFYTTEDIGTNVPTKKFVEEMFLTINIGIFFIRVVCVENNLSCIYSNY